jgi:2-oxoglutarate/2-oxoacid ferredoxin oxidoreductase subunit beta
LASGVDLQAFEEKADVTWCPGCGDFGILRGLKLALTELGVKPHEAVLVTGIGCGSKIPDYMNINGYMTIHGRPLAVATGAKLANPELTVIVMNGDGDSYGIGGNHFIHTCRRNPDITHIVEDNQVYGLTKGQYSPTSEQGFVTSTSPDGSIERALNPMAVALAAGATFVARSFAGDPKHVAKMTIEGMKHRGYALIDVLQPCVTFNHVNTYEWYRERVYHLDEEGHDPSDKQAAWLKAQEWGDRIPIGVLYQSDELLAYEDQVSALSGGTPVSRLDGLMRKESPSYKGLRERFL